MIRIYHTSDLHDRRGFAERLRGLRAQRPGLLFDSGDSLRGSQSVYRRDEPVVREIDAAGYDAQAVGNREFHYLFAAMRARASRMAHPLVCTNLLDLRGRTLPFARTLRFSMQSKDAQPVNVVVLAALVMQYPTGSPWERVFGWRFLDPWNALEPYVDEARAGDLVVVLSHLGLARDRKLASRLPRIDLILGGHSHDTLAQPEYAAGVPIVHAGPYARFVSRSELNYDAAKGRFAVESFELVPLVAQAPA